MRKLIYILQTLSLLLCNKVWSQQFRVSEYNVENGLHIDFVKTVVQDHIGFIWVGSDDGLTRFDGTASRTFHQNGNLNLIKQLYRTASGRLLVAHDNGLTEVISKPDTAIFVTILRGVSDVSQRKDSSTIFPKSIYEDRQGNIWLGEFASVACYSGKVKRYEFPTQESKSFLRSFSFAEDGYGRLWMAAHEGGLFCYNNETDKFDTITNFLAAELTDIKQADKKHLWVTSSMVGIYEITTSKDTIVQSIKNINTTEGIASIVFDKQSCFVGTWNKGMYVIPANDKNAMYKINNFPSLSINSLYINNNDVWISTNNGICLVQKTFLGSIQLNNAYSLKGDNEYIQSMVQAPNGNVYITTGTQVFLMKDTPQGWQPQPFLQWKDNFIARIEADNKGLWICNSNETIYYYHFDTQQLQTITNVGTGRYFNCITIDHSDNVWVAMSGTPAIARVSRGAAIFDQNDGITTEINVVRQDRKGNIYCGGSNPSAYLFVYQKNTDSFINISPRLPVYGANNFWVNDMAFDFDGSMLLATSSGVLRLQKDSLLQLDLGKTYSNENTTAITVAPDSSIWFSNIYGVLRYQNNTVTLFNKSSGLPATRVTTRNLIADKKGTLWIGTTKGVGVGNILGAANNVTPVPVILSLTVNGRNVDLYSKKKLYFNNKSALQIKYISFVFPINTTQYQIRVNGAEWQTPTLETVHDFYMLPPGDYKIDIRAQQQSNLSHWSSPVSLSFTIMPPWHSRWWGILIIVIFTLLVLWGVVRYYTWHYRNENLRLEKMLSARTEELNQQNEELLVMNERLIETKEELQTSNDQLQEANNAVIAQNERLEELNREKNSMMGIVAHDLRSPLANVSSLVELMEQERPFTTEQIVLRDMIKNVVDNGTRLIRDLLDLNAIEIHQQNPPDYQPTDLRPFISNILANFSETAHKKNISVFFDINTNISLWTDADCLRRIIENLVSNAIKFSPHGRNVFVRVRETPNEVIVSIKDEGQGFSDDDKQKMFRKFQKLSARPTADEGTSGLGLAIVKVLTERLEALIELDSKQGHGATFSITFNKYTYKKFL